MLLLNGEKLIVLTGEGVSATNIVGGRREPPAELVAESLPPVPQVAART